MYIDAMLVQRKRHVSKINEALNLFPIVAIIGARQVGKTTITYDIEKQYQGNVTRFDLEDPEDLARLDEPKLALRGLSGLIIIDEIQNKPNLFPLLRVLVDRPGNDAQFLVLGSASPNLLRQSSESLAGRIAYYTLYGFSLDEIDLKASTKLWLRGGFPRSFLAFSNDASWYWRKEFLKTFIERDVPQLGFNISALTLRRFWSMLAHYHGQIWNGSELARAFGISHTTVKRYVDLLSDALLVWQLKPWYQNISKRQVRSTKIYIEDTGILHTLLGIHTSQELEKHPKIGASWEGFVLKEIRDVLSVEKDECYFWATHTGAELDLLLFKHGKPIGIEVKRTTSPKMTPSIRNSMESLKLDKLVLIHAGESQFEMRKGVFAIPFSKLRSSGIFE